MRRMGTTKENDSFYRRSAFTDVWGAKEAESRSILVKPIHPKEEIQIILKTAGKNCATLLYYRQKSRKEMQ